MTDTFSQTAKAVDLRKSRESKIETASREERDRAEVPTDMVVSPRLVMVPASFNKIVKLTKRPRRPNENLRRLVAGSLGVSGDPGRKVQTRRLSPDDVRTGFRSGNARLDRFFSEYALARQDLVGTTYVALNEPGEIVGFVTAADAELAAADFSKNIPASEERVSALRLVHLSAGRAPDVVFALLNAVFVVAHCRETYRQNCQGVIVEAEKSSVPLYEFFGFVSVKAKLGELQPDRELLFLELGAIPRH